MLTRIRTLKYIRRYLEDRGFLEVETPILSVAAGGAIAKPFETKSVAFGSDTDLYLRIAPELYLKKMIIGGFERVLKLVRCFGTKGLTQPIIQSLRLVNFIWHTLIIII